MDNSKTILAKNIRYLMEQKQKNKNRALRSTWRKIHYPQRLGKRKNLSPH